MASHSFAQRMNAIIAVSTIAPIIALIILVRFEINRATLLHKLLTLFRHAGFGFGGAAFEVCFFSLHYALVFLEGNMKKQRE